MLMTGPSCLQELFMEEVVGRGYSQSSKEGRSSLAYQDLGALKCWLQVRLQLKDAWTAKVNAPAASICS